MHKSVSANVRKQFVKRRPIKWLLEGFGLFLLNVQAFSDIIISGFCP